MTLWEKVELLMGTTWQSSVASRECPECGKRCVIVQGRNSGKCFWSHAELSDCIFDGAGHGLFFDTQADAMNAGEMFK